MPPFPRLREFERNTTSKWLNGMDPNQKLCYFQVLINVEKKSDEQDEEDPGAKGTKCRPTFLSAEFE